ncbi:signal transduction histidine kinase [Kibdelosporangium banguiense]|uniref:histidine kinase n=1 Tax=Kibdelosporangium banguiense TaxID=1365924 RepID=A0ABS4TRC7_9PSEU|nr:HAMP domain-containing sensor histidine kinase [Kibdelosporangium banguiense]MBP2326974.1 signal transduction histidine kinase [Kibdelosporangium banguiense]
MKLTPRRITLRVRLTLIYGGLFLIAGVLLLGATYALFSRQLSNPGRALVTKGVQPGAEPAKQMFVFTGDGTMLTGPDAERWMTQQQALLHDAATTSLLTQGGIALGLVFVLATGFGWLVAGRVLRPLHQVTDTARRIAATADRGLRERIALRGPDDEVHDLAFAFNTMVERLDRSFDGQRRFVANASHELRTPLTLGRSLVELAMHRKSASADVKRLGEKLLQINSRHERLITGLLLLAKSEHEITGRLPVDLADLVTHVVDQTSTEATRAGIAVHHVAGEAPTTGDALLLERLVHNLVENGIRHNSGPGGQVEVTSRTRPDGRIEVRVSNTGPVVPHDEIRALFEPFRRLHTNHPPTTKGTGLGLSIVRSVAHAHGGDVTALPRDNGGLVVTVTLPACPEVSATSARLP